MTGFLKTLILLVLHRALTDFYSLDFQTKQSRQSKVKKSLLIFLKFTFRCDIPKKMTVEMISSNLYIAKVEGHFGQWLLVS